MDIGKIIIDEFNKWVYNNENQAGTKLQIIDACDLPEIVAEVVKKLTIPDVVNTFTCSTCGCHEKEWSRSNDDWYCKRCGHICR